VERWRLGQSEVERALDAALRAGDLGDAETDASYGLRLVLVDAERAFAERAGRRTGDDVHLGGRLDLDRSLGGAAGLELGQAFLLLHQLGVRAAAGATGGARWGGAARHGHAPAPPKRRQ
jgi:hypothetical protein